MEQYEQEKAFLEAEEIKQLATQLVDSGGITSDFIFFLSRYKTYLIEQAKKDKQSAEECLNQWDGLPLGTDETEWYPRKAVLRAMEEHARQFIPVAPAEKEQINELCERAKWLMVNRLFDTEEYGEHPDVCELYEIIEELQNTLTPSTKQP